jgi:hypothetical protein
MSTTSTDGSYRQLIPGTSFHAREYKDVDRRGKKNRSESQFALVAKDHALAAIHRCNTSDKPATLPHPSIYPKKRAEKARSAALP